MSLEYGMANELLINAFSEMKVIYINNVEEYCDLPYAFYESEFVPYIMEQLHLNNLPILNEIFDFIERLFADGDEMIINLVGVAVVESLFFEKDYVRYKNVILNVCGKKTYQSFSECTS